MLASSSSTHLESEPRPRGNPKMIPPTGIPL